MTTLIMYSFYLIAIVIGWIIFYYIVKAAVKNGIKEARPDKETPTFIRESKSEIQANSEQRKLQQRYDKGEIPFEVYKAEWDKLNN